METKWTKWYAMTSHVIAYRLLELLFSTHTFHFNCFFEDLNCVFTQIRCLSRVLYIQCTILTKLYVALWKFPLAGKGLKWELLQDTVSHCMGGSREGDRRSGPPEKSQSYQASIPCWAIIGQPAKRHLNGVSLAGWWRLIYSDLWILYPLIN